MSTDPKHFAFSMKPNEEGINDLWTDAAGNLQVARGAEAVAQHVRQRLMTFHGEWFLDINAGVMWLEDIMGHRPNPTLAEAMVKYEVLETPGVTGITSISIGYDRTRRELMIRGMDVVTEYEDQAIWIANVGITS